MTSDDLKKIAEGLIEAFIEAGDESMKIEEQGVKITIKEDGSPVTNGDLKVDKILTEQILKHLLFHFQILKNPVRTI